MMMIAQEKDEGVKMLELTIRSQINIFKYWTGEPPQANLMVNVLESLLKSSVFQVSVKEEENSDEEGQGQLENNISDDDDDDPLYTPSTSFRSQSQLNSSSSSLPKTPKILKDKKTSCKLRKQPSKSTTIDLNSGSSSSSNNEATNTSTIAISNTTTNLVIPVEQVVKDKSSRGREVRILDGHIFNFNRLNNSGTQSWVCRNRCGSWALEKDGEFILTKIHSPDCKNKPEKKNAKKTKIDETIQPTDQPIIDTFDDCFIPPPTPYYFSTQFLKYSNI